MFVCNSSFSGTNCFKMCKNIVSFSKITIVLFLSIYLNSSLMAQIDDSVAIEMSRRRLSFQNPDSVKYYVDEAIKICKNGSCSDTVLSKIYSSKATVSFNYFKEIKTSTFYLDTAIQVYQKGGGLDKQYLAGLLYNRGATNIAAMDYRNSIVDLEYAVKLANELGVSRVMSLSTLCC